MYRGSDGVDIGTKRLNHEEISAYALDGAVYRHFLSVNIPDTEERDMEEVMYGFLLDISHLDTPVRRLDTDDLREYVFNEINYPNAMNSTKKEAFAEKREAYSHKDSVDE